MEKNETAVQAANTDGSFLGFLGFLKTAGTRALSATKWLWRVDAVKSVALTWAIRLSVPGAPVAIAILDAYLSGS